MNIKTLTLIFKDAEKGSNFGTLTANQKEFKTGSKGFFGHGKITDPDTGKKYQVACNIVEIGSKPKDGKS